MRHADMLVHMRDCATTGWQPLTGDDFRFRFGELGQISGLYRPPFTFDGHIFSDGRMDGRNNFGTADIGIWHIADDLLHFDWQGGWDNTITRAYEKDGIWQFFDADTGNWRMAVTRR